MPLSGYRWKFSATLSTMITLLKSLPNFVKSYSQFDSIITNLDIERALRERVLAIETVGD